jgi:hypothetical protein
MFADGAGISLSLSLFMFLLQVKGKEETLESFE